ncbi:MAG: Electron transport complex subunit RsxD [Phycisphaerae bacterium]|nr:Electron transport complex subunit RsxD [Phycisphaerae bacterium]
MTTPAGNFSGTLPPFTGAASNYYRDYRWAMTPLIAGSAALFGWTTLLQLLIAILAALLCDGVIRIISRPQPPPRHSANVHLALLLAMTFPPNCWWLVIALAAALAVIIRQAQGGIGQYLWHPILVARIAVSLFFPQDLWPDQWSLLARNHLFVGDLTQQQPPPVNLSWFELTPTPPNHAWTSTRPVDQLASLYQPPTSERTADAALLQLIRDKLPPLGDCLMGTTGGGVGETSVLLILLGAAYLVWRNHLPLSLLIGCVTGTLLAAAWWPIPFLTPNGPAEYHWPIRILVVGPPILPIGFLWILYQLFCGELCFATCLLAGDRPVCPRRPGRPFIYGLAIGILTIVLRANGYSHGAAYWAILMAGTLTPLLNYTTSRATVAE